MIQKSWDGIKVPYFFAIDKDKDFTFTNKFYADEHALHMLEYRQAFRDPNPILDMGYTEGYKNTDSKKTVRTNQFLFKICKNFQKRQLRNKFKNTDSKCL